MLLLLSTDLTVTALFMSMRTPPQRHQSPHLITLYRNLLVSHSDTSNIESLEFPFHKQRGRGDGREADSGEDTRGERKTGTSQTTVGLRDKNTSGTLGGRHMSSDGGREGGTRREHPKVRQGESECLNQVLDVLKCNSRGCAGVIGWRLIGW